VRRVSERWRRRRHAKRSRPRYAAVSSRDADVVDAATALVLTVNVALCSSSRNRHAGWCPGHVRVAARERDTAPPEGAAPLRVTVRLKNFLR